MPARKLQPRSPAPLEGGMLCGPILEAPASGWSQLAMGEWRLEASAWADQHPFDEVNYVLEGRLVVECDGERMEIGPGEAVQVSAGSAARYSTSTNARMLYVYGPNPLGRDSRVLDPSEVGAGTGGEVAE